MATPASRLTQQTLSSQASDTVHRLKEAVCQIDTRSPGTGFLVTPNCLLTCCHVLPKKKIAQSAYARFIDVPEIASRALNPKRSKNGFYLASSLQHKDGTVGFTAKHLDFVIVALDQPVEKVSNLFVLTDRFPPQKEQIYVIQHPVIEVTKWSSDLKHHIKKEQLTGDKCIATGQIIEFDNYIVHHTAPVAGGSSGAPIVNDVGHLYAFHQGECTNSAHKKCTNPEHGEKKLEHKGCKITTNCGIGVRADAVFRYLEYEKISLDLFKEQRECAALKARYAKDSHLELVRPVRGYEDWMLKFPIDDIYAELVILLDDDKERDNAKAPTNPDQGLESYETLFMKKKSLSMDEFFSKLKSFKKILMLGTAGTGKTTFCQNLAFQWSKGSILAEYQSLFWIRLRHLKPDETLDSLFKREFGVILSDKHCSSALLILDGFDELPGYGEDLFRELTTRFQHVIVTSRPKINIPFRSPIRLEIIGLDTANRNIYIEHYFKALYQYLTELYQEPQPELPKEKVLDKVPRLQQLLLTHPLLASLAHIPINLSLLCAIFSQEETFLTDQQPITVTVLYDYIVNWIYSCFIIKQLGSSTSSSIGDIVSQSNPLSDPTVQSVDRALREIALSYTEKNKLYSSQRDLENFLLRKKLSITVKQLNDSGLFKLDFEKGGFNHLSYQDFFVARHLVDLYASDERKKAQDFVKAHKLQERYKWIFWMTAGLLSLQYAEVLPQYFEDLHQLNPDLGKSYELKLLARCYEECLEPDLLPSYAGLLKDVVAFLKEHPAMNLKVELFRDCSRLLHRSAVVEAICTFPTKSLEYLVSCFDRKQTIPDQILEEIVSRIKNSHWESRKKKGYSLGIDTALEILKLPVISGRILSQYCLKFVCSVNRLGVYPTAFFILKGLLSIQKKILSSFEAVIEWMEKLNLNQEVRFCLFIKALMDQKKDSATEAAFIVESFNRYTFGAFLGLNQLTFQEIFDKLVRIISDPSYTYDLKSSSLKLIQKMVIIDSVNCQHVMMDLIDAISSDQNNEFAAKALKTLFQTGVSISEVGLTRLINFFENESKKELDNNPGKSFDIPEPNEWKSRVSTILAEFVKNQHLSSNHILNLISKNHCLYALLLIVKAKKGYAKEAFELLLKDTEVIIESIFFLHDFEDLLENQFIDLYAQILLKLFYSQEFISKYHVVGALSGLSYKGYFFSLEDIDNFIGLIKRKKTSSLSISDDILGLLTNMVRYGHPNSRDIIKKIWPEFKTFSIRIKQKLANILALSDLTLPLDIFKNLLDSIPNLNYQQLTNSLYFIEIVTIEDFTEWNSIFKLIIKQDCLKLSLKTIENFLNFFSEGAEEWILKEVKSVLSQLKYKDYISEPGSRDLFIRIAYLTGQPFIEAEQS